MKRQLTIVAAVLLIASLLIPGVASAQSLGNRCAITAIP